jgi:hypothetical protein
VRAEIPDRRRLPSWQAKREELAVAYARDGYALLEACLAADAPEWLAEVEAVQTLRVVLEDHTRALAEDGMEVTRRGPERGALAGQVSPELPVWHRRRLGRRAGHRASLHA